MATSHAETNEELLARDHAHLIHPLHNPGAHQSAHVWERGEGARMYDAEGKEYIDGLSGLWNVFAGHGRKEIARVAAEQMETLGYCSGYTGSSNRHAIALAEKLSEWAYPSINHFFFTSGGGESSDSSFKTARYYWKRKGKPEKTKVISRQWGYHGVTLAAMSATGIKGYWPMFEPRVPGFLHVPSPYPYRYEAPEGTSQGVAAANELERAIQEEGPDTVAMFIAEPVQGAGGVIVPQDDYFARIREICDQYEVLLVSDEVITGFGRTGKRFGLEHWDIEPDIMQFAKSVTSGYFPLGGIGMGDHVADVVNSGDPVWMHAYTYSSHPVGCRVALENIRIIEDEGLTAQAEKKGGRLISGLRDAVGSHAHVGEVRGLGLMCAIEIVADKATKEEFPAADKVGPRVHAETDRRGLFSRTRGDVYVLAPPAVITDAEIDRVVSTFAESLDAVVG